MRHEFVRAVPETLAPHVLYVSIDYLTTSHLCACGCGEEVVLPLHPTKWRVTFDGATVSMHPSIGSRALACRSHYWIDQGRIRWAARMSDREFDRALERDLRADDAWHGRGAPPVEPTPAEQPASTVPTREGPGMKAPGPIGRLASWLRRTLGL